MKGGGYPACLKILNSSLHWNDPKGLGDRGDDLEIGAGSSIIVQAAIVIFSNFMVCCLKIGAVQKPKILSFEWGMICDLRRD